LFAEAIGQVQRNVLAGKDLIGPRHSDRRSGYSGNGNIRIAIPVPQVARGSGQIFPNMLVHPGDILCVVLFGDRGEIELSGERIAGGNQFEQRERSCAVEACAHLVTRERCAGKRVGQLVAYGGIATGVTAGTSADQSPASSLAVGPNPIWQRFDSGRACAGTNQTRKVLFLTSGPPRLKPY